MTSAEPFLPDRKNLRALQQAARNCRGCELYRDATQTVFGSGPRRSQLMLLGEMPGDEEDQQGKPFVGPAGRLLDKALLEAGLSRRDVFVTNAVKHFRWKPRGKRRLHNKPTWRQIEACQPWLQAEILVVQPKLIVCLGATAAQSVLGRDFRVTKSRGTLIESEEGPWFIATYHPSAILRAPERADREQMQNELVDDLRRAAAQL